MAKDSFDNWDELISYFSDNYEDASGETHSRSSSSDGKGGGVGLRSHVEIRKIIQELMREIRNACSAPPWHLHYIFYSNPMTIVDQPDGSIVVTVPFTEDAYRRNMFNTHYSFIPILMDQGWHVRKFTTFSGKSSRGNGLTYPTFEYFVGTGELTRIIDNFNARYANKGFHAELVFDSSKPWWFGWE